MKLSNNQNKSEINEKRLKEREMAFIRSTNLQTVFEYASDLSKYSFTKRAIFSIMAAVFVGITFLVYAIIKGSFYNHFPPEMSTPGAQWPGISPPDAQWSGISSFIGALIFPFAIFAILYLGGNLFTSNSLMYLAMFKKIMKPRSFVYQLIITWVFNLVGSLIMVGLAYIIILNNGAAQNASYEIAIKKVQDPWYVTFVSGLVCNILVSGSVYGYKVIPSKTAGFLFVYLSIVFFSLSGFQHTVTNMFIIPLGLSYSDHSLWGKYLYDNLLPITISNTIGGLIIPVLYIMAETKFLFQNKHSH